MYGCSFVITSIFKGLGMAIQINQNSGTVTTAQLKKTTAKSEGVEPLSFKSLIKNSFIEGKSDQAPTAVTETKAPLATDSVVLTNSVQEIKKSFESFSDSSVHAQRLERIKQAIENGTYEINPDRIASKMIQFEFSQGQSNGT
ncbi:MAG: Anti-sigma-28 factor, FlgM [Pseudomonadota bacterium]|jgi:negative regulator of flagellin synthesis FlgM